MLAIVSKRIYRESFRQKTGNPIVVETYCIMFATAREGTLEPGLHHVSFHPLFCAAMLDDSLELY